MTGRGILKHLLEQQILSPLSYFFARFITRQAGEQEDGVLGCTAALLSERSQQGDVCLELPRFSGQNFFATEIAVASRVKNISFEPTLPLIPDPQQWRELLAKSSCVGIPGQLAPLIIDGDRLYLSRFWSYEEQVAQALLERSIQVSGINTENLQHGLQRLFPDSDMRTGEIDWQKLASALAVSRQFAVISGGPGTGKTTTVVKVLALLLEQNPDLQIRLAAPTGKAAARMVESIRSRKNAIEMSQEIRNLIPDSASTLHRLLSYDGKRFRYTRSNQLTADCLVVDEASMIDLNMMAALLAAMPAHARLILLGDRDQLASVEAGNILGDITGHGQEIVYSPQQAGFLAKLTGIEVQPSSKDLLSGNFGRCNPADSIALLRTSHRFYGDSGIGRLSRLVNQGLGKDALSLLLENTVLSIRPAIPDAAQSGTADFSRELSWLPGDADRLSNSALEWAVANYSEYLQQTDVREALALFNRCRVLCATHAGELGEGEFNRRVEERLTGRGMLVGGELCHGKPVMVTVNDYELELFNGDIGLLWRNENGELRAWFPQINGEVRDIAATNLPQYTSAWALTVHKSQGSEFDQVLLVLPQDEKKLLLSRELIYTGITRAKKKVIVHGKEAAFLRGCENHVQRSSGLAERLGWQEISPHRNQ
jgi:exodeoxyribonuclease V alpha subunit